MLLKKAVSFINSIKLFCADIIVTNQNIPYTKMSSKIKVKLQLKCPDGASFKLAFVVDYDDKVEVLQENVVAHTSFKVDWGESPVLKLNDRVLDSEKTVRECNITESDVLIVQVPPQ